MFKPVNRHVLVSIRKDAPDTPSIILPEDYKLVKDKYCSAIVESCAEDIRFNLPVGSKIIIDQSMIEQIVVDNTTYNVILDNYVVGIVER